MRVQDPVQRAEPASVLRPPIADLLAYDGVMSLNGIGGLLDRPGDIDDPCVRALLLFLHRHPRAVLTSERLALYVGYELSHVAKSLDGLIIRGLVTRVQRPTASAPMFVLVPDGLRVDQVLGDASNSPAASSDGVATISRPPDTVWEGLREGPVCVSCLARSASMPPVRVLSALAEIGQHTVIVEELGACAGCGVFGSTHATQAAVARPTDLSGSAILVVDDDEDTMDLYAWVLEQAGAIVQRATNMLEALNLLQQVEIDIVLTDMAMPGASGWDMLREVQMRAPGVPIVAVTGQLIPDSRALLDQGFAAALLKPIDLAHLVAVVNHLVHHERA